MTTAPAPFEDPEKTALRARCEIAIDQAGFALVDPPETVQVPSLRGGVKGDLQSLDAGDIRYCYYLRPSGVVSLPQWLANLATATHQIDNVKLYIVAELETPELEKACRAAGAGLLTLTADNTFTHVIDFDAVSPPVADSVLDDKVSDVRRALERKLELNKDILKDRLAHVVQLTKGMPARKEERYAEKVEGQYAQWEDWGVRVSERLDAAYAARDADAVEAIRADVEAGPLIEDD